MFRNELLDLNDILNYIRLAPQDSPAASPAVSNPPPGSDSAISTCPALTLLCALSASEAAVQVTALIGEGPYHLSGSVQCWGSGIGPQKASRRGLTDHRMFWGVLPSQYADPSVQDAPAEEAPRRGVGDRERGGA